MVLLRRVARFFRCFAETFEKGSSEGLSKFFFSHLRAREFQAVAMVLGRISKRGSQTRPEGAQKEGKRPYRQRERPSLHAPMFRSLCCRKGRLASLKVSGW